MNSSKSLYLSIVFSLILHGIVFSLYPIRISESAIKKKEMKVLLKIRKPIKKPVEKKVKALKPKRLQTQKKTKVTPKKLLKKTLMKKITPKAKPTTLSRKIVTQTKKRKKILMAKVEKIKKIEIKKINTNVRQKAKAGFSRKSPHKPVNYRDNFAPKADSIILKTALPGPLPPPTQVTSKDRENEKHRFYDLVLGKIEQAKVYPKIAKKMQIEGEVPLSFKIYPDGTVGEINILTSARNHELLKRAAMTTIQKASPYTPIPSDLRKEKGLKFKVKISYKLN